MNPRSDDTAKAPRNPRRTDGPAGAFQWRGGLLVGAGLRKDTGFGPTLQGRGPAAKSLRSFDFGLSSVLVKARARALWSDGGRPTLDPVWWFKAPLRLRG